MKKLLISGLIILLVGAAVFVTGMSLIDWDFKKLDGADYVEKIYTAESEISSLTINAEDKGITIKRGGDRVTVKYSDSEYDSYVFAEENGTLNLTHTDTREKKWWLNFFNFAWLHPITVTVPVDCELYLDLRTKDASVNIEGGKYGDIKIVAENSSAYLDDFSAAALEITSKNGKISLENGRFKSATLQTTNESLVLENVTAEYVNASTTNASFISEECSITELTASSTNGAVRAEDFKGETLSLQTTNGSVSITESDAKNVRAVSSNGSIYFELTGAENMSFKTTNASVKGKLYGADKNAFRITSSTTGASNNLGSQEGDGSGRILSVNTTNGSIKVEFLAGRPD